MSENQQQPSHTTSLYVITNHEPFHLLKNKLTMISEFDCVTHLQYRRKHLHSAEQKLTEARELHRLCLNRDIHFVINDDVQLAHQLQPDGACGVHLGQSDGSITKARTLLGANAIIGSTCHQSLALALKAQTAGASYVAFGAYRTSETKPHANTLPHDFLDTLTSKLNLPICVIGGITATDVNDLKKTPASMIAVIQDILAGDIKQVEQQILAWHKALNQVHAI